MPSGGAKSANTNQNPMNKKTLMIAAGICGLAITSHAQLDPSLVAWYRFDEGAGATVAANAVGGSSTGAIQSGVTTGVAGISGNAYSFNNSSTGYVDMGNASFFSSINTAGALTFSVWVKPADNSGGRNVAVFAGLDSSSQSYTDLGFVGTGDVTNQNRFYGRNRPDLGGAGPQQTGFFSANTVTVPAWYHLVLTVDLSTAVASLYVNGVLSNTQAQTISLFPAFNNFEIGRLGRSSPTDFFGGLIDDVQIYNSALSAGQVAWLYNNPGEALTAVPEPAEVSLAIAAGLGLLIVARRGRTTQNIA